jgi:hypothetical protein
VEPRVDITFGFCFEMGPRLQNQKDRDIDKTQKVCYNGYSETPYFL